MPELTVVEVGDLAVYLDRQLATIHGRPITLKPPLYRLLAHLARHKGETIKKMDLLDAVYGSNASNIGTMDKMLHDLRHALLPNFPQFYIETVERKGIRLRDPF